MYIMMVSHPCFVFAAQPYFVRTPPTFAFSIVVSTLVRDSCVSMKAPIFLGLECDVPTSRKTNTHKTRSSPLFPDDGTPATQYCEREEKRHNSRMVEGCLDRLWSGGEEDGYAGAASTSVYVIPAVAMAQAVGARLLPSPRGGISEMAWVIVGVQSPALYPRHMKSQPNPSRHQPGRCT